MSDPFVDGTTKEVEGEIYAFDKASGKWIPLEKWENRKYGAKMFRQEDVNLCYFNIYSYNCLESLLLMIRKKGDKADATELFNAWMDAELTIFIWIF